MAKTEETWSEGKRVREAIKLIDHCIDIQGKCKRMREKEIKWVDIKGFEGRYKINQYGEVLSTGKSENKTGTGNYDRKEKILTQSTNNKGYKIVHLYKDRKDHQLLVHRLVAEMFLDNPYNYEVVNHKDENPENNCLENLEWCTQKYNMNYGTSKYRIGKKNSKKVLQFSKDGILIKEHSSIIGAARELNISDGNIGDCLKGRTKTAGGYVWKYAI